MTAINFPDSPSDGDTHVVGGVTYTYNNAETKWKTTINSNAFLPLTGGTVSGNILMGGEIQHDGDTDTNIAFDTDTILFDTAGSERFRVGSAGQLGIGGATYGSSGQVLTSGGASAAPSWSDASNLTRGTAVTTTSGSSLEFTSLPSGIRRITLLFSGFSTAGTSSTHIQLGTSSAYKTSGYASSGVYFNGTSGGNGSTTSAFLADANAIGTADICHAHVTITNITGDEWVSNTVMSQSNNSYQVIAGGNVDLGGTLTRIKIFKVTGTDTFDAGKVNIMYEV